MPSYLIRKILTINSPILHLFEAVVDNNEEEDRNRRYKNRRLKAFFSFRVSKECDNYYSAKIIDENC